jgi:hypothetical protein
MDVTRDSSPRPDSWPPAAPELPHRSGGATQLGKAVAEAVAKPLIKARPVTVQDELDTDLEAVGRTLVSAPTRRQADASADSSRTPPVGAPVNPPVNPPVGASSSESRASRRPPRTDPTLREHQARSLPGWLALLVLLAALTAAVLVLAQAGVIPHLDALPEVRSSAAKASGGAEITAPSVAALSAAGLVALATLAGLLVNAGGETRVLTRWGSYRGTVRRTGLLWVNPVLRRRRVDIRLRHWRSEPVQVADRTGTPIVVRLLIVWRSG